MAALLPMAVLPVALLSMHTITMATLHTRHVHATSASATSALVLSYSLTKARSAAETDKYGKPADDEVAFHAARALSLLSSHAANQRKILRHGGLKPMYALAPTAAPTRTRALTRAPALFTLSPSPTQTRYALARLADPDIQAEAATVIANVTSTIYDAQMQVSTLTVTLARRVRAVRLLDEHRLRRLVRSERDTGPAFGRTGGAGRYPLATRPRRPAKRPRRSAL